MLRQERTNSVSDIYHVMLRDTNHWLMKHKVVLYATLVMLLLTSCRWEPDYPQQLTQADSLIMRGYYAEADSLLSAYDSVSHDDGGSVAHYRRLLALSRQFVDDNITSDDFSLADSLCRYYDGYGTRDKYGKALCFLGEVYNQSGDYPSAMNTWLNAKSIAEDNSYSYLACWLYRNIGDLYFEQRMLEECIDYYRKYYQIAIIHQDTLRMAMATNRMGKVYIILNNVDSTLYYYKKSIALAGHSRHPENIIPYSKHSIADVLTQIEEYDQALPYMSHDALNNDNWAYWHLGMNNIDSAIWYFEKEQEESGIYGKLDAYNNLTKLEENRHNIDKALQNYKALVSIKDSIQKQSQSEEIRRIHAQYNLNLIKSERDEFARQSSYMETALHIIIGVAFLCAILAYYVWNYFKQKRYSELSREKLLRQIEEDKYKQSVAQIESNKRKIEELKKQLQEAQQQENTIATNQIRLDSEQLIAETQSLEVKYRRHQFLLEEFQKSPIYIRLKIQAGKEQFHLTDEEWQQLGENIDRVYDNFTQRLFSLVQLSDIELKTCYLIKLKVAPADIAVMLYKSKTAISMLRQRLYKKITHKSGTAKQLDEFILNF